MSGTILIFQWPFKSGMALLLYLADKKRAFPQAYKKALVYIVAGLVAWFATRLGWSGEEAEPAWWPNFLDNHSITFARTISLIISLFGSFSVFIFTRAIVPLLFFVPQAMAMRSMGLQEANVRENGMQEALKKYLKWHDNEKKIKVICISGFNLFGRFDGCSSAPLYKYALNGKLEVLFPRSDSKNPTIKARYDTYKEEFKSSQYPKIDVLISEIQNSKRIVSSNTANKIFEHDELCMWRVVLLSEHCLVQSYFPNRMGCHSDLSPVFVFEQEPDCPHSYYDTYLNMFTLLSEGKQVFSTA